MRIIYHHRIAAKDGQYVHIEELVTALKSLGHEVLIVGPKAMDQLTYGQDAQSVAIMKRFIPRFLYEFMEFGYNFVDYLRLARQIRRFRPDIIYERYNLYFFSGIMAKRRFGLPLILEVNAPLFAERSRYGGLSVKSLARWTERLTWRGADHIVTVTRVLARLIQEQDVAPDRIDITPNGINRQRFPESLTRIAAKAEFGLAGKLVLGFVGFVRVWHGLDKIIDLLATFRTHDWQLVIVGGGPAVTQLRRQATSLGVSGCITFTGHVERDVIAHYVNAFDVALQPDVVPYASPLKLFEYMACGCAIVAPDRENIREILSNGENALLFDPDDAKALGNAVSKLIVDPDLQCTLGKRARNTILARNLTWQHNAEVVTSIARSLTGAGLVAA